MSTLSRDKFERLWERLDAEALAAKQSQEATVRLTALYRSLDEGDREVVNAAIAEWVVGDDNRRRFDALALVREFEIRSAVSALQQRLRVLAGVADASAADERDRIERIATRLS
jgi:hypothetical protein